MRRALRLTRETLTELTSSDLTAVAGAADPSIGSCPVKLCVEKITGVISDQCYTQPCPSVEAC